MQSNMKIKPIEQKQQDPQQKVLQPVSFSQLFRFSTKFDWLLMIVGSLCACGMGAALPLFTLFWGDLTNSFGDNDKMVESSRKVMLNFIYIGIGALASGWGMFACWILVGQRQGIACRREYLKSLLKQEIGWFDTINQSQLATKFATDSFAFQGAIGQKVSTLIMTIAMFVAGFAIAFSKGWLMTLVCIAGLPLVFVGGALYGTALQSQNSQFQKVYGKAGGLVEQAVSSIKTVKQLNGQSFEVQNYQKTLKEVTDKSSKFGMKVGFGIGVLFFAMLTSYSLGFWFGSHCVEGSSVCLNQSSGRYSAGDTLVIFFSILMAGFNFAQVTPALKKIAQGRIAAARIFKIIDREPQIKSMQNALKPNNFNGVFKFQGVSFAYPKNKNRKIVDNITFQISHKSTAFVGQSGCGKSTIFQLMMRFYDPDEGRITLDGVDLKQLDLNWLRSQIGYVGQQPVLFAASLRQNIIFGKQQATQEEITSALKKAEAYDFVNQLKEKLNTYAGSSGSQISGGQKQRIAIARALLKNPKILLLDEATSALDRRNQKLIQNTLNKIAEERVTITIAHRIRTVMNCQQIFVFDQGKISQNGRFNQLQKYKNTAMEKQDDQQQQSPKKNKIKFQSLMLQTKQQQIENKKNQEVLPKQQQEKKQLQELVKKYDDSIFGRLFGYVERKGLFVMGLLAAMCNGTIFPIFSIFLAKMLAVFIQFDDNRSQARSDANLYALLYLLFGIASFTFTFIQQTIFSVIGAQVTQKIRNQTFQKILKMPIIWFDKPKNSCGAISVRLASDCQSVNGLVTTYLSIIFQNLTNLLTGIIIAFIYQWRTTLVALALIPLMIIAGAIQMAFMTGFSDKTDAVYKDSSNLITQSMINIRTVSSFGYQNMTLRKYEQRLVEPLKLATKKGNVAGILYGLSQFVMFIVVSLIFYLGAIFIRDNNLKIADVFTAIYSIMFAGMTAGNNSHFMPDVNNAKKAAANLFEIIDGEDEDQLQIKEESKLSKNPIKGHILFKQVCFKYQTRNQNVFENLNLQIQQGKKIGFVGRSGCGKSTIFQLLQRFYEPDSGQITIDGIKLKDYDIHYLRSCLGVVSQEPVLFNQTIGNNIKYNKTDATKEDIINAANQSNFNPQNQVDDNENQIINEGDNATSQVLKIESKGFNKNVGVKGSHISGGQKQRVAIARSVIRNPKILLLDEATSALDSANQIKVQQSLDRIMNGKTSINIAHRIDTIKNSDEIMVFQKGKIVEKGGYSELTNLKGYFYKLQKGLQLL